MLHLIMILANSTTHSPVTLAHELEELNLNAKGTIISCDGVLPVFTTCHFEGNARIV